MTDDIHHIDPFANMYLQENRSYPEIPQIYRSNDGVIQELIQDPSVIENDEEILLNDNPMLASYIANDILGANANENDDDNFKAPEIPEFPKLDDSFIAKKKGRPPKPRLPGEKPPKSKPRPKKKLLGGEAPPVPIERLPKMKSNVHSIKLTPEQIEELKKEKKDFFQPGVCFVIAPELEMCLECLRQTRKPKKRSSKEVDCRFYYFRKLRYEGDSLVVSGFLDPVEDPKEIDKMIWIPHPEKSKFRMLSIAHARLILSHVGDELCHIIAKERIYYETFRSDEKPVIWKRLIDSVIEICDLCNTTLFNYHLICTKCGLSLCIDCAIEQNKNLFKTKCSIKDHEHSYDDLHLTQIIVDDCLDRLQRMLHDVCKVWDIIHECKLETEKILQVDKTLQTIIRNIRSEPDPSRTLMSRELGELHKHMEVDFSNIKSHRDAEPKTEYVSLQKKQTKVEHIRPVRYLTQAGRENVISISRSMSQATSNLFYKDIPHKWLCENKLLRLMDPSNTGNEDFFHDQWQRGQPVLISNVVDKLDKKLWLPQSFSNEFGGEKSDFINCMTGNLVRDKEISLFWDGFEIVENRLKDSEGVPMLLKLKDWPPDSDFKKIMPSRFDDIMNNLPMKNYTHRNGDLNIIKYLPTCFIHPDLGPKGYFAYGSPYYLKEGTTNLHLDVSDACNVMCYIGFPRDKSITIDEYVEQGFRAILEADCDISNIDRVLRDGEIPGAIWHIYEASDADRIRDFLLKIAVEKGFKVADDHDVIHDQNWYLDGELRKRLHLEYGVKGYAIVQFLGDCIILPAGTPHQVRNIYSCIKIAEDFVSPQQMAHCLHLSEEFRKLTKTHTNNEEKLNIKNIAFHSVKEAIASLIHTAQKTLVMARDQRK